jgi:hypothetical protein
VKVAYLTNANVQPRHKQLATLDGLQYRTRPKGRREPRDPSHEDPPHGNLMTALVVHPGRTKLGILVTALVDLTGTRQHGTQEAPTLGAGTVPIHGKVTTAAKVEIAANHAAETTLVGGTEFFKLR